MNRFPVWKYLLIALTVVFGLLYTLPNLFGESPAVQVSSARSSVKVDTALMGRLEKLLADEKIAVAAMLFDGASLKVKLQKADDQLRTKELIQRAVGDGYVVALNLIPDTPALLAAIGAHPMALGLDLRGGVHFLLELDMKAAVEKAFERIATDARRELRQKKLRYGSIKRVGDTVEVQFRDTETTTAAKQALEKALPSLVVADGGTGSNKVLLSMRPEEFQRIQGDAIKQNVAALHNRINELGVAEPVIQQQGAGRIVVQLPGVQDTAKAKDIIGRTASLEVRMVDDERLPEALSGTVPAGFELMEELDNNGGAGNKILVRKDVELTGENITDAQAGFTQDNLPAVHIRLDSQGAESFRQLTRDNVNKRMAMILVEKGKGQVVTAPVIRTEIGGGQVQISGAMNTAEANDIALLLRAGSLAAPMNIVEERTIGPSLGKENISKGFYATIYGFVAVVLFMGIYYRMFGLTASIALFVNLLLLLALLSLLRVTLTLPGIAAIALTLGMAIDSNVLINERVREEVRNGMSPQAAINAGYEHAWSTILDSNITTLIAGLALLIFGSGSVRGFAWVHCLGIMTSMFSAVFVSRALVNLIYGYRQRLKSIAV